METGTRTPVIHTGPIETSKLGERLRYPLYPEMVALLLGDHTRPPTTTDNRVDAEVMKRISNKHHWLGEYSPTPLFGVTAVNNWAYNDEIVYSDYFCNLRIGESTNLSVSEFLDLPYDLATHILDRELARAEKEIKEEKERKAKQEAKLNREKLKSRLKR